jgi:hypothetical protein
VGWGGDAAKPTVTLEVPLHLAPLQGHVDVDNADKEVSVITTLFQWLVPVHVPAAACSDDVVAKLGSVWGSVARNTGYVAWYLPVAPTEEGYKAKKPGSPPKKGPADGATAGVAFLYIKAPCPRPVCAVTLYDADTRRVAFVVLAVHHAGAAAVDLVEYNWLAGHIVARYYVRSLHSDSAVPLLGDALTVDMVNLRSPMDWAKASLVAAQQFGTLEDVGEAHKVKWLRLARKYFEQGMLGGIFASLNPRHAQIVSFMVVIRHGLDSHAVRAEHNCDLAGQLLLAYEAAVGAMGDQEVVPRYEPWLVKDVLQQPAKPAELHPALVLERAEQIRHVSVVSLSDGDTPLWGLRLAVSRYLLDLVVSPTSAPPKPPCAYVAAHVLCHGFSNSKNMRRVLRAAALNCRSELDVAQTYPLSDVVGSDENETLGVAVSVLMRVLFADGASQLSWCDVEEAVANTRTRLLKGVTCGKGFPSVEAWEPEQPFVTCSAVLFSTRAAAGGADHVITCAEIAHDNSTVLYGLQDFSAFKVVASEEGEKVVCTHDQKRGAIADYCSAPAVLASLLQDAWAPDVSVAADVHVQFPPELTPGCLALRGISLAGTLQSGVGLVTGKPCNISRVQLHKSSASVRIFGEIRPLSLADFQVDEAAVEDDEPMGYDDEDLARELNAPDDEDCAAGAADSQLSLLPVAADLVSCTLGSGPSDLAPEPAADAVPAEGVHGPFGLPPPEPAADLAVVDSAPAIAPAAIAPAAIAPAAIAPAALAPAALAPAAIAPAAIAPAAIAPDMVVVVASAPAPAPEIPVGQLPPPEPAADLAVVDSAPAPSPDMVVGDLPPAPVLVAVVDGVPDAGLPVVANSVGGNLATIHPAAPAQFPVETVAATDGSGGSRVTEGAGMGEAPQPASADTEASVAAVGLQAGVPNDVVVPCVSSEAAVVARESVSLNAIPPLSSAVEIQLPPLLLHANGGARGQGQKRRDLEEDCEEASDNRSSKRNCVSTLCDSYETLIQVNQGRLRTLKAVEESSERIIDALRSVGQSLLYLSTALASVPHAQEREVLEQQLNVLQQYARDARERAAAEMPQ